MSTPNTPTPNFASEPTMPLPTTADQRSWGPTPPDSQPPKKSKKHLIGYPATALLALAIGAAGGGGSSASPTAASPTVVVTQSAATPAAQTVTQTVQSTVTVAAPATAAAPAKASPAAPAKAPAKVRVPDGVGMNYQEAQDAWRAAGLHVAPANDATGANRIPVLDSNWVVLAQDLESGSKVPVDSFITATIKKYTDG